MGKAKVYWVNYGGRLRLASEITVANLLPPFKTIGNAISVSVYIYIYIRMSKHQLSLLQREHFSVSKFNPR